MRLVTSHSRRLRGLAAMACAGALATAVALTVTTFSATASAATPACTASGLVAWLDTVSSGAAGSFYYHLQFTNLSGHTCTLTGYPGVSGVDLAGHQIGSAASRNAVAKPAVITLASETSASTLNTTASVVLRITDVGNYPASTCKPATAAGLRVYVPGQTASTVIPYPFRACSRSGPTYLSVEAVTKGAFYNG